MAGDPMTASRNTTIRDRHRATIKRGHPPCGICGEPIDYTLTVVPGSHGKRCKGGTCRGCTPHPERYEVDHIIAIDNGGTDTLDNKQAAHRRCNRAKSNKTDEQLARAKPREYVTARTW